MYQEKIINALTDEITLRNYTENEIAEVIEAQKQAEKIAEEISEKNAARKIILDKLGITEEEAKLLLS